MLYRWIIGYLLHKVGCEVCEVVVLDNVWAALRAEQLLKDGDQCHGSTGNGWIGQHLMVVTCVHRSRDRSVSTKNLPLTVKGRILFTTN